MNQTFNTRLDFQEDTKISDMNHFTSDQVTNIQHCFQTLPRIFLQLLDTQRQSLTIHIDVQDLHFNFVPFVVHLMRITLSLAPGHIRNVNQSINTFIQSNKDTEVSNVTDFSFNNRSRWSLVSNFFPRIRQSLFHGERNSSLLCIQFLNDGTNFITHGNHTRWLTDFLSPRHFRNVNQAFNTLFNFNESTVVSQADHFSKDLSSHRVLVRNAIPRISGLLLQT